MSITRLPTEWAALVGLQIIDPDGWRGPKPPPKAFNESIEWREFCERIQSCTVRHLPDFVGWDFINWPAYILSHPSGGELR